MPGCPCSFMPTFLSVLSMLSMLSMPCGSLDRSMCIVSGEFIGRAFLTFVLAAAAMADGVVMDWEHAISEGMSVF